MNLPSWRPLPTELSFILHCFVPDCTIKLTSNLPSAARGSAEPQAFQIFVDQRSQKLEKRELLRQGKLSRATHHSGTARQYSASQLCYSSGLFVPSLNNLTRFSNLKLCRISIVLPLKIPEPLKGPSHASDRTTLKRTSGLCLSHDARATTRTTPRTEGSSLQGKCRRFSQPSGPRARVASAPISALTSGTD